MKAPDFIAPAIFILISVVAYVLQKNRYSWRNVFSLDKKAFWLVSSLSLIMLGISAETGQIFSGIIYQRGLWGLWFIWVAGLGAGLLPLVFAGLWARMGFITDNQFLLFRFSGKGARVLHKFRAIYVGLFVIAILLSFQLVAFSRILSYFIGIPANQALLISGLLLMIFSLKNTYQAKLYSDVLNFILFFGSFLVAFVYLWWQSGGISTALTIVATHSPERLQTFPASDAREMWNALWVFLGIQWWSTQILDGSGPEAQRFVNTRGKWGPLKAGLLPIFIQAAISFLMVIFILMGMSLELHLPHMAQTYDPESMYAGFFAEFLPTGLKGLALVGFFAAFITTAEGRLNWGASFLMVDLYKQYYRPAESEKHYVVLSFGVMVLLSLLAMFFAWWGGNLQFLFRLVFSIGAGVGPVFVLRWFWLRINAWSQLSAMISSGVYAMGFLALSNYVPSFEPWLLSQLSLDLYSAQILCVTLLTTFTWLAVTFLTPPDSAECLEDFRNIMPAAKTRNRNLAWAMAVGVLVFLTYLAMLLVLGKS
ncbi:MAG: sodium:solute symporter family transporter [Bacteroidales bacterium]